MQYTFAHSPDTAVAALLPLQTVCHRLCRLPTVAVRIQHILQAMHVSIHA